MIDKSVKNDSGTAKTAVLRMRIDAMDAERIQRRASDLGMSLSEYLRRAALGVRIAPRRRVEIVGMSDLMRVSGLLGHVLRELQDAVRRRHLIRAALLLPSLQTLYRQAVQSVSKLQVQAEGLYRELNGGVGSGEE